MSDTDAEKIFGEGPSPRTILFNQAATYMIRGAAYGAAVFFGVLIFIWVLILVSKILPEDSKNMPDPINRGALEAPLQVRTI